ncbi:LexA family transcriptional regulator [Vitreoscilla massiliensis]|nr:LexA family transcriptional regulator [Vitreoscilla massiliensis]
MNAVDRAKKALGVTTDLAMAQALGVHATVIGGYKKRESVPLEQCIKIADKTGVDLNWLILGKGIAPDGTSTFTSSDFIKIPVYDIQASAGNGYHNEFEVIIDELWLSPEWVHQQGLYVKDLFCVEVLGDSMAHPPSLIMPKDKVLINRAVIDDDGVFLVRVGAALRLKRLQWLYDGRVTLISDNPIYQPETIDPENMGEAFQVLGHAHSKFGNLL